MDKTPSYIEPVEVYRTHDGETHETAALANEHIANKCRAMLDKRLAHIVGKITMAEKFRIIMALIPDANAANELYLDMDRLLRQ
jgi:hypothetical protein